MLSKTICVSCLICLICLGCIVPFTTLFTKKMLQLINVFEYHNIYPCPWYIVFLFGSILYNSRDKIPFFLSGLWWSIVCVSYSCRQFPFFFFFLLRMVWTKLAFTRQALGESFKLGSCIVQVAITFLAAREAHSSRWVYVAGDVWFLRASAPATSCAVGTCPRTTAHPVCLTKSHALAAALSAIAARMSWFWLKRTYRC